MVAILRQERKVVRRFREAGATSAAAAKSIDELNLRRGLGLRRLRERAVIREAELERYYLDEKAWAALGRTRRRAAVITLALVLGVLVVGLAIGWLTLR